LFHLLQVATPDIGNYSFVSQIKDTGLLGALVIAVAVLWRSLVEKDKLLIAVMKDVTAALTAQVESNKELRKVISGN